MWDAKVGMKVVSVQTYMGRRADLKRPVIGQVYTIRDIAESPLNEILLLLEEIPDQDGISQTSGRPCNVAWPKDWFRPLNNIDKGMEVLRSILVNPQAKITGFEQKKIRRKVRS
jgi:hypothetical protein